MEQMASELQELKRQPAVDVVQVAEAIMPDERPKKSLGSKVKKLLKRSLTPKKSKEISNKREPSMRASDASGFTEDTSSRRSWQTESISDRKLRAMERTASGGKPMSAPMDDEFMAHFFFHQDDDCPRVLVCPKKKVQELRGFPNRYASDR